MESQIRKSKKLYAAKAKCLCDAVRRIFGEKARTHLGDAGFLVLMELDSPLTSAEIAGRAAQAGVAVRPVESVGSLLEKQAEREEAANQEETAVQAEMVNRMETGKDPREAIRHLIKTENPRKPFSDRVLSEKLAEAGITLSRRTVAKYREEMGIRDASGRKCFGI